MSNQFTLGGFRIDRVEEMSGPYLPTELPARSSGRCAGPGSALAGPEAL